MPYLALGAILRLEGRDKGEVTAKPCLFLTQWVTQRVGLSPSVDQSLPFRLR
jgi:hypothetical protein